MVSLNSKIFFYFYYRSTLGMEAFHSVKSVTANFPLIYIKILHESKSVKKIGSCADIIFWLPCLRRNKDWTKFIIKASLVHRQVTLLPHKFCQNMKIEKGKPKFISGVYFKNSANDFPFACNISSLFLCLMY